MSTMTLSQLYDEGRPEQTELLWNYVGLADFDVPFKIVQVNPMEIWKKWKDGPDDRPISYSLRFANKDQKNLINRFRLMIRRGQTFDPIVIWDESLVDGFHRVAAMALEKVPSCLALDLSQEAEE